MPKFKLAQKAVQVHYAITQAYLENIIIFQKWLNQIQGATGVLIHVYKARFLNRADQLKEETAINQGQIIQQNGAKSFIKKSEIRVSKLPYKFSPIHHRQ